MLQDQWTRPPPYELPYGLVVRCGLFTVRWCKIANFGNRYKEEVIFFRFDEHNFGCLFV